MSVERLCQPSHRSRQKLANQVQWSPRTSCRSSHVAIGNGDGGKIKMGIFVVDAGGTIIDGVASDAALLEAWLADASSLC